MLCVCGAYHNFNVIHSIPFVVSFIVLSVEAKTRENTSSFGHSPREVILLTRHEKAEPYMTNAVEYIRKRLTLNQGRKVEKMTKIT